MVRCEWGPAAVALAADLGPEDLTVVVDVLSFSTTVTVAVAKGIAVWPMRWRDDRARALAEQVGAVLAVERLEAELLADDPAGLDARAMVSLSPAEMSRVQGVSAIVLPSPNGSTITAALADSGVQVAVGCLRNASAVADRAVEVVQGGGRVLVVPAGERWPDGSLRPALEDWWGAGAVLARIRDRSKVPFSVEASAAASSFEHLGDPGLPLAQCGSGRELIARGYGADVEMAAAVDAVDVVAMLRAGRFV